MEKISFSLCPFFAISFFGRLPELNRFKNTSSSKHHMGRQMETSLTSKDPSFARESGVLDGAEDGIIHSGFAGNAVPEPLQRVVPWMFYGHRNAG